MRAAVPLLVALCLCLASGLEGGVGGRLKRRHAFLESLMKRMPAGYKMEDIVEICETCGSYYGPQFAYNCLYGKASQAFQFCLEVVQ